MLTSIKSYKIRRKNIISCTQFHSMEISCKCDFYINKSSKIDISCKLLRELWYSRQLALLSTSASFTFALFLLSLFTIRVFFTTKYLLYSNLSVVHSDLCKLSHLLHLLHSQTIFLLGAIAFSVTNGSQSGSAILENSSVTAWIFLSRGGKNSIALI